jgi:hypothetical protein
MLIRRRNRNAHIRIRIRIRDGEGGKNLNSWKLIQRALTPWGGGEKKSVYLALKPQNAKPENREITKCKKKKGNPKSRTEAEGKRLSNLQRVLAGEQEGKGSG